MRALRLAVCAVLLVLAGCAPRQVPPGLSTLSPHLTPGGFMTADGVVLPMRSWLPQGDRLPKAIIVALHGFNDYSEFFEEPGSYLAGQGVASFAYDQRGFGQAPNRGRWAGTQAYVDDLRDVTLALRQRYPGVPLYLLGESMGGAVVMVAETSANPPPADGIILAAPAIWARQTMPFYQTFALWIGAHTVPWMEVTGRGLHIQASDNIPMLRKLGRDPLVIKETRVDAIWGLANLMDEAFDAARKLDVPALICYGEHDEVIPADAFRQMLAERATNVRPAQRVAIYENGWHMLLRDLHADVVWTDIDAWIGNRFAELPSAADVRAREAGLTRFMGQRKAPAQASAASNG